MKYSHFTLALLTAGMIAMGCSKTSTEPEGTPELSDSEQMMIVAAELATDNGGAIADLQMLAGSSTGNYSLAKAAGVDTTISIDWMQYSLNLAFYNGRGGEQQRYVPGVTDSVVYRSKLTGAYQNKTKTFEVGLNSSSSLNAADMISNLIKINGVWNNHSTYGLSGALRKIDVASSSSIAVEDVVIDLSAGTYFPSSGKLTGTIEGVYTAEGPQDSTEQSYSFPFTITFNGGTEVTVSLPSGKEYTLDLATGDFS